MNESTPANPESLLEHADWVRRLAQTLVDDPHGAEDVVQETWLAALTHPSPRRTDDVGIRAWLGVVLRNFALRSKRTDQRRLDREREVAVPDLGVEDVLSAEHLELHRRLVHAVEQLDGSSRTVVMMRFFDSLPPREIAARMNLPGTVVRKRLSRALQRLRSELDREYGGDRRTWCVAWAAALAAGCPRTAAQVLPSGALLWSGATALLAVAAWAVWPAAPALPPERVPGPLLRAEGPRAQRTSLESRPSEERVPTAAPTLEIDEEPGAWIEGKVIVPPDAPEDDTLAAVLIRFTSSPDELPPWLANRADPEANRGWVMSSDSVEVDRTGVLEDGRFRLARPEEDERLALVVDGRYLYSTAPTEVAGPEAPPVELEPRLGVFVRGSLDLAEDERLRPEASMLWYSPQVRVFDRHAHRGMRDRVRFGTLDERGRFFLRGVPAGRALFVGVRTERFVPTGAEVPPLAPGEARDILLSVDRGTLVRGRTVDDTGRPVAGARVVVTSTASRVLFSSAGILGDKEGVSDEDGAFLIEGVQLGMTFVFARQPGSMWSRYYPLDQDSERDGERFVEIVIPRGSSVAGRVHWPDGSPAVGAEFTINVDVPLDDSWIYGKERTGLTDDSGGFRATGLGPGSLAVTVFATRVDASGRLVTGWARLRNQAANRDDLAIELEPALDVSGFVVDESDEPIEEFELLVERTYEERFPASTMGPLDVHRLRDANGYFLVEGLAAGGWQFRARAEGFETSLPQALVLDPASASSSSLRIALARARTLEGRVVDPHGRPVPGARIIIGDEQAFQFDEAGMHNPRYFEVRAGEGGYFRVEGLPAAPLEVIASKPGWAKSSRMAVDATQPDPEAITLALRLPGVVRGRATVDREPVAYWTVYLIQFGEGVACLFPADHDGRFQFLDVPPGPCRLVARPNTEEMRRLGLDPNDEYDEARASIVKDFVIGPGDEVEIELSPPGR